MPNSYSDAIRFKAVVDAVGEWLASARWPQIQDRRSVFIDSDGKQEEVSIVEADTGEGRVYAVYRVESGAEQFLGHVPHPGTPKP